MGTFHSHLDAVSKLLEAACAWCTFDCYGQSRNEERRATAIGWRKSETSEPANAISLHSAHVNVHDKLRHSVQEFPGLSISTVLQDGRLTFAQTENWNQSLSFRIIFPVKFFDFTWNFLPETSTDSQYVCVENASFSENSKNSNNFARKSRNFRKIRFFRFQFLRLSVQKTLEIAGLLLTWTLFSVQGSVEVKVEGKFPAIKSVTEKMAKWSFLQLSTVKFSTCTMVTDRDTLHVRRLKIQRSISVKGW